MQYYIINVLQRNW